MRLIDADKLNFSEQHYNKSQMKAILDFIDNQPTAYDVNKVLRQLDEKKNYRMQILIHVQNLVHYKNLNMMIVLL